MMFIHSSIQSRLRVVAFFSVLLLPLIGFGSASAPVVINSAQYDPVAQRITIVGQSFGSTAPTVRLAGMQLPVISYDPNSQTIVASVAMSLNPGSYLITVSIGNGTTSSSEFDIAIGAV